MPRKRKQVADKVLAKELALYAINDYKIYKQRLVPFTTMFAKKKAAGTFDKKKAVKGLANNLAKNVQVVYYKDARMGRPPVLDGATKTAFGKYMFDEIKEGVRDQAKAIKAQKKAKATKRKVTKRRKS